MRYLGLVDHIKDVASRFAKEGYPVLAPNLFSDNELEATLSQTNISVTTKFFDSLPPGKRRRMMMMMMDIEICQKRAFPKLSPRKKEKLTKKNTGALFGGLPKDKVYEDLVSFG